MTTRRNFLIGAAQMTAAYAASLAAAQAQPAKTSDIFSDVKPVLDIGSGGKVAQICMVVRNASDAAKALSKVFGARWSFYDYAPTLTMLDDKPAAGATAKLRLAIAAFGGRTFKLVEPVSGATPYSEFLQSQGEGFFSISVGLTANYDRVVNNMRTAGVKCALQVENGDGSGLTVLDTAADIGLRVEMAKPGTQILPASFRQTGTYAPPTPAIINMDNPVYAGGRLFVQLGLVVAEPDKRARRWAELFGVRQWTYSHVPFRALRLNGRLYSADELPSASLGWGGSYLGDMQIELLEPVPEKPGGSQRAFFDRHWPNNGFQHLALSPTLPSDHRQIIQGMLDAGMKNQDEYILGGPQTPVPDNPLDFAHYMVPTPGFVLEY